MDRAKQSLRNVAEVAAICLILCVCASARAQQKGSTNNVPGIQQGIKLVAPVPNGQWTTPGGDYGSLRYSPLDQINTTNVKNLHYVTSMGVGGIPHGYEGSPLVVNDTMYVVTPYPNYLFAYDLTTPGFPQKWMFDPDPDVQAVGHACCDTVNKGPSYADGKIVFSTLDNHVIAVDAKTGKQIWNTVVGDVKNDETLTQAPLIVKDRVMIGISGGELGVRGRLTGLDLGSGKIVWRAWSNGPDSDVLIGKDFKPFYKKDQGKDLGVSTWANETQYKRGGGTVWGWMSYDPELNLVYYGTGNSAPWNEDMRPGDNKWNISLFARDPETGMAKWGYQVVPHAGWDYDQIAENILIDMKWDGKWRKILINSGKIGYVLVMDRETGQLLSASNFIPVNWSPGFDLQTGQPKMNLAVETHEGKWVGVCPANTGGKDIQPSSFSPRTGLQYIPANNQCIYRNDRHVNYIADTPYVGTDVVDYKPDGLPKGDLIAWDVAHGKKVWDIPSPDLPLWSGILTTGGDVLFYGTLDGWFKAVDARNGKPLWQFKTPSGIVGSPMTFIGPDHKQYIAIYSGVGGALGSVAFSSVSLDDPSAGLGGVNYMRKDTNIKTVTAPGGSLYVFSF